MRDAYVVLDVGCLECEIPTSVIGTYTDYKLARKAAEDRARWKGTDLPLGAPDPYPFIDVEPRTTVGEIKCYGNQSSIEVHKISG